MRTLIIQPSAEGGELLELGPGEEVVFGRGGPGCQVDLVVPDLSVSRVAGRIRAVEDHWVLSNLSSSATYVVENPEGGGEFFKVAPRRLDAPVPFEFARVVLPSAEGRAVSGFQVYAPEHAYCDELSGLGGTPTQASFPLDETAKYFIVLIALCEPRLRDCSSTVIPTVPEILERLRPLESCRNLTRSAVNFHIDYLATTKLRVKSPSEAGGPGGKADWQRAALASTAVRFDLVREEHLGMLPARVNGGRVAAG